MAEYKVIYYSGFGPGSSPQYPGQKIGAVVAPTYSPEAESARAALSSEHFDLQIVTPQQYHGYSNVDDSVIRATAVRQASGVTQTTQFKEPTYQEVVQQRQAAEADTTGKTSPDVPRAQVVSERPLTAKEIQSSPTLKSSVSIGAQIKAERAAGLTTTTTITRKVEGAEKKFYEFDSPGSIDSARVIEERRPSGELIERTTYYEGQAPIKEYQYGKSYALITKPVLSPDLILTGYRSPTMSIPPKDFAIKSIVSKQDIPAVPQYMPVQDQSGLPKFQTFAETNFPLTQQEQRDIGLISGSFEQKEKGIIPYRYDLSLLSIARETSIGLASGVTVGAAIGAFGGPAGAFLGAATGAVGGAAAFGGGQFFGGVTERIFREETPLGSFGTPFLGNIEVFGSDIVAFGGGLATGYAAERLVVKALTPVRLISQEIKVVSYEEQFKSRFGGSTSKELVPYGISYKTNLNADALKTATRFEAVSIETRVSPLGFIKTDVVPITQGEIKAISSTGNVGLVGSRFTGSPKTPLDFRVKLGIADEVFSLPQPGTTTPQAPRFDIGSNIKVLETPSVIELGGSTGLPSIRQSSDVGPFFSFQYKTPKSSFLPDEFIYPSKYEVSGVIGKPTTTYGFKFPEIGFKFPDVSFTPKKTSQLSFQPAALVERKIGSFDFYAGRTTKTEYNKIFDIDYRVDELVETVEKGMIDFSSGKKFKQTSFISDLDFKSFSLAKEPQIDLELRKGVSSVSEKEIFNPYAEFNERILKTAEFDYGVAEGRIISSKPGQVNDSFFTEFAKFKIVKQELKGFSGRGFESKRVYPKKLSSGEVKDVKLLGEPAKLLPAGRGIDLPFVPGEGLSKSLPGLPGLLDKSVFKPTIIKPAESRAITETILKETQKTEIKLDAKTFGDIKLSPLTQKILFGEPSKQKFKTKDTPKEGFKEVKNDGGLIQLVKTKDVVIPKTETRKRLKVSVFEEIKTEAGEKSIVDDRAFSGVSQTDGVKSALKPAKEIFVIKPRDNQKSFESLLTPSLPRIGAIERTNNRIVDKELFRVNAREADRTRTTSKAIPRFSFRTGAPERTTEKTTFDYPTFDPPKTPTENPPSIPKFKIEPGSTLKQAKGAFLPFAKVKGRFVRLSNVGLPYGEALTKGYAFVAGRASRTFKLVPYGTTTRESGQARVNMDRIYAKKGQPLTFIEKRRYGINSPGELREITYKGAQARRVKAFGGRLLRGLKL